MREAKNFAWTIFKLSIAIGLVVSTLLVMFRHEITAIFTADAALQTLVVDIFPFLFVVNTIDSMQMTL